MMIRRAIIITAVITTISAAFCILSQVRQFGYIGTASTIGLREGTLWYVWRSVPLDDSPGFYCDAASRANRSMYEIDQDAKWLRTDIWRLVFSLPLFVGYCVVLLIVRKRLKRPPPRWLAVPVLLAGLLFVGLWGASQFAIIEYQGSSFFLWVEKPGFLVTFGQQQVFSSVFGQGWDFRWNLPRWGASGSLLDEISTVMILPGSVMLNLPLGILTLALLPPATLFIRMRRIPPGHCQRCGYDLTANASGRCPECGTEIKT